MINIIITVDYEIFGNGRGDVRRHIINPMNNLLNIAKRYSVPLTIMFEVYEYLAYEKFEEEFKKKLRYSPAREIKSQIISAYDEGHDVQLHIHPQFVDMEYKNGNFILKYPTFSIGDFQQRKIYEILRRGKDIIREMINIDPVVIRLSNMPWDEPPENTLKPMVDLHFKAHSLALSENSKNTHCGFWKTNNTNIFEIPIYTIPVSFWEYFTIRRLFIMGYLYAHDLSNIKRRSNFQPKNMNHKRYLAKWDFSKLNAQQMIHFLDLALKKYNYKDLEIPLVMIGHTKDFFNKRNFGMFLETVEKKYVSRDIVQFTTFRDFLNIVDRGEYYESYCSK